MYTSDSVNLCFCPSSPLDDPQRNQKNREREKKLTDTYKKTDDDMRLKRTYSNAVNVHAVTGSVYI